MRDHLYNYVGVSQRIIVGETPRQLISNSEYSGASRRTFLHLPEKFAGDFRASTVPPLFDLLASVTSLLSYPFWDMRGRTCWLLEKT
jgi:hypothetical protein